MKKLVVGISVLIAAGAIVSCGNKGEMSQYSGYKEVSTGLHFKLITDNSAGRAVTVGDILTMNMSYSVNNDTVIFDTKLAGQPVQLRADTGKYEGDFMHAFLRMKEGDSASVIVDANMFFTKTAGMPESPEFIDSADVLYFAIVMTKVQTMEEVQAEMDAKNAEAEQNEQTELNAYLAANNIEVEPTASGLYFISTKKGTGRQAEAGKKVKVNYSGFLLNGTYFDTSVEEVAKEQGLYDERRPYGPLDFELGARQVIQGWDEGIAMMKVGGTARLVIPSTLAYGANPRPGGVIQPFNTLVFDVELVEVTD